MLNESIPTASARTASSTTLRITTSPLSGCPDSSTVTKANVSNPNSISWLVISLAPPALRLQQLKVELDLHDIAKDDAADAGGHGEVDAEVLAADLGRGFEARVAGA